MTGLYIAIITYILSVVAALVFLFIGNKLNRGWFRMTVSLHLLFAISFIVFRIATQGEATYFSFLFFNCTGLICCALAYSFKVMMPLRLYFSVYLLTIALFLISPSTLFNYLLTARFSSSSGKPLPLTERLELERQSAASSGDTQPLYKLVEKKGFFHQTLRRNLSFGGTVDSVRVLSFEKNHSILVRGYTSKSTYVSEEADSIDLFLELNPHKRDVIERR